MSEILVNTLTGKTTAGDITVTSEGGAATMQLQQGLAKSWCKWTMLSTQTVNDSFNIASIQDNGTGRTELSATNSMSTADYAIVGMSRDGGGYNDDANCAICEDFTITSSVFEIFCTHAAAANDASSAFVVTHGDLA